MEIKITGTPKEIAALVVALQERQETTANIMIDGKVIAKETLCS